MILAAGSVKSSDAAPPAQAAAVAPPPQYLDSHRDDSEETDALASTGLTQQQHVGIEHYLTVSACTMH